MEMNDIWLEEERVLVAWGRSYDLHFVSPVASNAIPLT